MADEDDAPVATTMEKMAEIKRRRMDELTDSGVWCVKGCGLCVAPRGAAGYATLMC